MSVVAGRGGGMEPRRDREGSLVHVIETLLDKGLVLNADIMVSVAGVELLGIRIRAALASFETAARYGLEFPSGTNTETIAWRNAIEPKETCPRCGKTAPTAQLLNEYCPWCGWRSARAIREEERRQVGGQPEDESAPDVAGGPDEPEAAAAAPEETGSDHGRGRRPAARPDKDASRGDGDGDGDGNGRQPRREARVPDGGDRSGDG
ncbi:gas vesicle protein [Georgenia thermotolerans]|uniref:gas vesicle protein n=1 Tax=Georgenia thermotolerans TaxID=527326 RepID=UPI0024AE9A04|nr:gas vesicle protein [Georgenia thermotolerans]